MKSVWHGSLSFGLVTIQIQLFSAVREHVLGFKLLCGTCKHPIRYERWCRHCNKEVPWSNIVKGLEIGKNKYFILTQENIKKLKAEKTDVIDINEFVDISAVDALYYDQSYYVVPDHKSIKPFSLFSSALEKTGKAAVGTFVMRDKEHVVLVRPHEKLLLLTTLHYAYEVVDAKRLTVNFVKVTSAELQLAVQLIKKWSHKKFDITKYKDTFAQRLLQVVQKKGKAKLAAATKKIAPAKESSLVAALKKSIKSS